MMLMPERPKNTVLIVVKSPTLCEYVFTKPDQSIFGLRALIGAKFEMKLDFIILVYAGKILIDVGTLDQHNIDEGSIVYLVEKKSIPENSYRTGAAATTATMSSSQRKPGQYSLPSAILMRVNVLKGLIHTFWPQMENMVNEPNMLREILFNDPRMKHIMDRHPSIRHHINNDAYIREMMQCILCPARLDELNRKRDLMLLRVENTPGGAAILNSINSSLTESLECVPVSRTHSSKKQRKSTNNQLGKENCMPLPNPWTRPRKTRKQVPRFLRRLTRLNKILPIQIHVTECKSTQTDQNVEEEQAVGGAPDENSTPRRIVRVILKKLHFVNPQSESSPILGKLMSCVSNGFSHLAESIQKRTGECANVDNVEGTDAIATDPFKTPSNPNDDNEYWPLLENRKSDDSIDLEAYGEISTGYEETTKVTKPNGESVLVTKRTLGTNTDTLPSFEAVPEQQNVEQSSTATVANPNAAADPEQGELPPEIRYRDQLDHLASLGFNNRNENLVALMESLGDVNAAAELLLQIKKEKL